VRACSRWRWGRACKCCRPCSLAEAELEALARSLERAHPGAAASLREGLAETLTITPAWSAAHAGPNVAFDELDRVDD
jgi:putative transposase